MEERYFEIYLFSDTEHKPLFSYFASEDQIKMFMRTIRKLRVGFNVLTDKIDSDGGLFQVYIEDVIQPYTYLDLSNLISEIKQAVKG